MSSQLVTQFEEDLNLESVFQSIESKFQDLYQLKESYIVGGLEETKVQIESTMLELQELLFQVRYKLSGVTSSEVADSSLRLSQHMSQFVQFSIDGLMNEQIISGDFVPSLNQLIQIKQLNETNPTTLEAIEKAEIEARVAEFIKGLVKEAMQCARDARDYVPAFSVDSIMVGDCAIPPTVATRDGSELTSDDLLHFDRARFEALERLGYNPDIKVLPGNAFGNFYAVPHYYVVVPLIEEQSDHLEGTSTVVEIEVVPIKLKRGWKRFLIPLSGLFTLANES